MESKGLIDTWRSILVDPENSWVLFQNGTCVLLTQPGPDLAAQATEILREWGPVRAGSSSGNFSAITLTGEKGWAVTCHHDDILTYVSPDEGAGAEEVVIGLLGRSKRARDAEELRVLHVEDKRGI